MIGDDFLRPDEIFVADSSEGPKVVLTIGRDGSSASFESDIHAAGNLLRFIWTTRSRVANAMELHLISRMNREEAAITASEASNHFSVWPSCKILSFFTEVSDILEPYMQKTSDVVRMNFLAKKIGLKIAKMA